MQLWHTATSAFREMPDNIGLQHLGGLPAAEVFEVVHAAICRLIAPQPSPFHCARHRCAAARGYLTHADRYSQFHAVPAIRSSCYTQFVLYAVLVVRSSCCSP